eukprot:6745814-Pyramimonas_sp.AAC.1
MVPTTTTTTTTTTVTTITVTTITVTTTSVTTAPSSPPLPPGVGLALPSAASGFGGGAMKGAPHGKCGVSGGCAPRIIPVQAVLTTRVRRVGGVRDKTGGLFPSAIGARYGYILSPVL